MKVFPHKVSVIAAISREYILGVKGKMPWHLPEDLRDRFKPLTVGGSVIMGRKTFESIGKALPDRTNIVLSSDPHLQLRGCYVMDSFGAAIKWATQLETEGKSKGTHIIGGASVYEMGLRYASHLYLTLVDKRICDLTGQPYGSRNLYDERQRKDQVVYFPFFNPREWTVVKRQSFGGGEFVDMLRTFP